MNDIALLSSRHPDQLASLADLAAIPEEDVWLASQKSARTRRAYKLDVAHFMKTLGITTPDQLRQVDHPAVIAWERIMREEERAAASTARRRLAALSSLFKHLVRHGAASRNPVVDVARPSINRKEGSTAAFSKAEARRLLDAPAWDTLAGLRDRAILSVGLQVGLRRAEIAGLTVGDLHQNRGYDALRLTRKGGRRDALAINPQAAARIRAYLEKAGHSEDRDGPMFRPLGGNAKAHDAARVWTRTRSIGCCENMPLVSAWGAATRRTPCGRPSSPPRWRTAHSWRTCRRRLAIATHPRRSFTTAGDITPRRRRAFLRLTKVKL